MLQKGTCFGTEHKMPPRQVWFTFVAYVSYLKPHTDTSRKISPNFTFIWPCIVTYFFTIKPIRFTNFTNLFWHETLHITDSSSVHHQEFIHCTLSNGICSYMFVDSYRAGPDRKLFPWVPGISPEVKVAGA